MNLSLSYRGNKVGARRIGVTVEEYVANRAAGMSWCADCFAWLPAGLFTTVRPDKYDRYCREHRNARTRDMYRSNAELRAFRNAASRQRSKARQSGNPPATTARTRAIEGPLAREARFLANAEALRERVRA